MIQIYSKSNTDFSKNGDVAIEPISCDLESELNGVWTLTLTAPVDTDGRYSYIQNGAVICAPTWVSDTQYFRIYNTVTTETEVTAYATPIFMDCAGEIFLIDKRPTNKNGQEALDEIFSGQTKYKGRSDIKTRSTAYYVRMNAIEAIQSDNENSFLNRWGGEVSYNNYTISVDERVGRDNGAKAEMGFNCTGIEADIDDSSVVTRIVPVAYNGYTLEGDKPWVDSPLINSYPIVKTKEIKFEDVKLQSDCQEGETGFADLTALRAELVRRCKEQFTDGIDKPLCNYKCDMIDLAKTDMYSDIKGLEQVELGDTVHCSDKKIGIDVDARVIRVEYDCIKKCNDEVELGNFKENFFNEMTSTIQRVDSAIDKNGNVIGGMIQGFINGAKASLRVQQTAAERVDARAILFEDLDETSPLYGAMCMGTQGFQISKKRTSDGKDWDWSTAVTANGMIADYIVAGILASRNYDGETQGFCFNLDNGNIRGNNATLDYLLSKDIKVRNEDADEANVEPLYVQLRKFIQPTLGNALGAGWITAMYLGMLISGDVRNPSDIGCVLSPGGNDNDASIKMYKKNKSVQIMGDKIFISPKSALLIGQVNDQTSHRTALSGRAVFSDGSYLEFQQGMLVAWKTM